MGEIQELKLILREESSPFFSDEEVAYYLEKNNGDIKATAYECLVIKSENDSISLPGGLNIADNQKYWLRLAQKYRPNGSKLL
jgi:hypothetical protein